MTNLMPKTELNEPTVETQIDAPAAEQDNNLEINLTDADFQLDETELERVLAETNATVEQASQETQAATAAAQANPDRPPARKPLTVTQEAAVTTFNEMTDMLGKYDMCRAAVERIGAEMRDLRIALDSFEPGQLIETTVAGIRIPMTASAVLEAKRVELARAMDYMRELSVRTTERAEAMAEASYLDAANERHVGLMPPRRSNTRGPVIRERAPDAPIPSEQELGDRLEAEIREATQTNIKVEPLPQDDEIPNFLRKGPITPASDGEEEPRGLFRRMASKIGGRNSG